MPPPPPPPACSGSSTAMLASMGMLLGTLLLGGLGMWVTYERAELGRSRHQTALRPHDGPCEPSKLDTRAGKLACLETACRIPAHAPRWPANLMRASLTAVLVVFVLLSMVAFVQPQVHQRALMVAAGPTAAIGAVMMFAVSYPISSFDHMHGGIDETADQCVHLARQLAGPEALAAAPPPFVAE